MEKQSKLASFVEALVNTFTGFVFSFFIQLLLNHAYDVEMPNSTAAWFVFWFTVASIVRSYVIRRLWTNEFWKKTKQIKNFFEPSEEMKEFLESEEGRKVMLDAMSRSRMR